MRSVPVLVALGVSLWAQTAPVRSCKSGTAGRVNQFGRGRRPRVPGGRDDSHPPAGDRVKIYVALPITVWNGRFQGTGGGGFRAAILDRSLNPPAKAMLPR